MTAMMTMMVMIMTMMVMILTMVMMMMMMTGMLRDWNRRESGRKACDAENGSQ